MNAKRKIIISFSIIAFVLIAVVATMAMVFALSEQTIKTSLNIGYSVEDIDGSVSATFTIGGVEESLTAYDKNDNVLGETLVFLAEDDVEDKAGYLKFPEDGLALTKRDDNVVIKYTYKNNGDRHFIATMSFDAELVYNNMKVEYGIVNLNTGEITYSTDRYALVVPTDKELSYYIRISIVDKARSASFTGDFNWSLVGCDDKALGYEAITGVELTGSDGVYTASFNGNLDALDRGTIIIPDNVNGDPVTSISANENLTTEQKNAVTGVYVPETIETIGNSAFEGYTNLETVTLEQTQSAGTLSAQNNAGLKTIGANAFKDCSSLNNLTILNTVTTLDETALTGCSSLKDITLDTMNTNVLENIKTFINSNSGIHLIIGNSVTTIPDDVFFECSGITSVKVESGVTNIGAGAFSCCYDLTIIELSEGLKTIGSSAFAYTQLTSVVVPDSVTYLSDCFALIWSLRNITIGKGVTTIDYGIFGGDGITISGLTSINVSAEHPKYHSVNNCIIETATNTLVLGIKTSVIPTDGSVTSIGMRAFYGVWGIETINIPNTITEIGYEAFFYNSLTSITIPASVTTIKEAAFQSCYELTSITFENTAGWSIYDYNDNVVVENVDVTSANTNLIVDLTSSEYTYCVWKRS